MQRCADSSRFLEWLHSNSTFALVPLRDRKPSTSSQYKSIIAYFETRWYISLFYMEQNDLPEHCTTSVYCIFCTEICTNQNV